jgi:hypothetical protein
MDSSGPEDPVPDAGSGAPSAAPEPDGAGPKRCRAKCKATGERCRRPPVTGYAVCDKHGAGTRKRVENGTRKPPGRPPVTGEFSDPERTRYGRLSELLDAAKADTAGLRTAELELALCKACVQWQFEKLMSGEWDVMKTPELMEHPASWLLESASRVIDKVAKLNAMINRDRVHAMVNLIDPVITIVLQVIEQHVPTEARVVARESVRKKLSAILVPT